MKPFLLIALLFLVGCSTADGIDKFKKTQATVGAEVDTLVNFGIDLTQEMDIPRLEKFCKARVGFCASWLELNHHNFPTFFAWVKNWQPRPIPEGIKPPTLNDQ